jgi:signal transduction histidine kinase
MVAMVVGALALAGLGTLGLTVLNSVDQTRAELVKEAQELAQGVEQELSTGRHRDSLAVLRSTVSVLKGPLGLQGEAVLAVSRDGSFYNPLQPAEKVGLPSGLSPSQIETANFFNALPVSGSNGRLAWAAELLENPVPVSAHRSLNVVVVLTREAPTGVGSAALWFGLASAATVVVALVAANRLGHRIARPLRQTEVVTGRIAGGDLDARVQLRGKEGRELVSLANSVNRMAANLARAQQAQRQFLMSVSHDLRTPLTSIRGFAEAIADGTARDVSHAASVILSEARRLERLVADLLELAKLEAGAFSLHVETVDLSEVATDVVQAFEHAAAGLGLRISVTGLDRNQANASAVFCEADPDRLGQVVSNVVENALKYAASEVAVKTGLVAGEPALVVEDDGPGIPPEDIGRVFQRLYQSPGAASRKLGSGLGLAIVDELVRAMGGRVRAESPLGPAGGARIVVTLRPARAAHPVRRAARLAAAGSPRATRQRGGGPLRA